MDDGGAGPDFMIYRKRCDPEGHASFLCSGFPPFFHEGLKLTLSRLEGGFPL